MHCLSKRKFGYRFIVILIIAILILAQANKRLCETSEAKTSGVAVTKHDIFVL
jgi:hypothetical protein